MQDTRQEEQRARFQAWADAEGIMERPVTLDTILMPHQQARIKWLQERVEGEILEVGCNWGYVLAWVKGHAGVDINAALMALAKVMAPSREFHTADARSLPFPKDSFDTVMLVEVLEHLPWEDVSQAVSEALRVARKKVLVTIPDGREDTPDATNLKHRWLMDEYRSAALPQMFGEYIVDRVAGFVCIEARL